LQRLLPRLAIVNVVATAELNQLVNLEELVHVPGFFYDTAVYSCAYLKDSKTRGKVSIFSTGKMISIGARSFEAAKHDLSYAARRLARLGLISPTDVNPRLQNIVATGDIGHMVDIERFSLKLPDIIYEPEQFPGAIYHARELEGASILIFASGKVVFAGLKSLELLQTARQVLAELDKQTSFTLSHTAW
jgi:transcription initiation factor TFIID TATA-box-binding protein